MGTMPRSSLAGPFTIELTASYFGQNDLLVVVRSADCSIDLLQSPQDFTVAKPGAAIGHFHAPLPTDLRDRFAALLPEQLSPQAVLAGHVSPGSQPVMDSPSWGVTVEADGVRHLLHAPETHDVGTALRTLLAQAREEARKQPVEAIRVDLTQEGDDLVLGIENVGRSPVTFAVSKKILGLSLSAWDDPPPGVTQMPRSSTPLPLREALPDEATLRTLEPAERYVLHATVPGADGHAHRAVSATWFNPESTVAEGGVFRVRGAARSEVLELAPTANARVPLDARASDDTVRLPPQHEVAPEPDVRLDRLTGLDETPGAVRAIARLRPALRRCFNHGLESDPSMQGSIDFTLNVTAGGRVLAAEVTHNHDVSSSVADCCVKALRTARLELPGDAGLTLGFRASFLRPGG
jgi:hypothetical protein